MQKVQNIPNKSKCIPIKNIEEEKLKAFCLNFNPYIKANKKDSIFLEKLGIPKESDPFTITNKLLVILDELEGLDNNEK